MRRFALVAALVALPLSAQAADLPYRSSTPAYAPYAVTNWTGLYVGGQLGYTWSTFDQKRVSAGAAFGDLKPKGVSGGLHAGWNYQSGQWVGGLETDWNMMSGSSTVGNMRAESDIFGTARVRVGYAIDRYLPFVAAGLAFSDGQVKSLTTGVKDDRWHIGYTVGAGVEAKLTDNWSARAEYLYSDFNGRTYVASPSVSKEELSSHTLRVGASYRFNM